LLEDGKERYTAQHDIGKIMGIWTIKEANSDKVLGKIEHRVRFRQPHIVADGIFGHYYIHGNFGNHKYTIQKRKKKVAKISKKDLNVPDTYNLTVYGDTDRALMVLFTIIVDEIRQP